MKRYYIIFKGRVQGVGFRWTLCQIADKYGVTGWCRNLENGDVDCQVQGEEKDIDLFLKDILNAKGFIRIDDYALRAVTVKEKEYEFIPLY